MPRRLSGINTVLGPSFSQALVDHFAWLGKEKLAGTGAHAAKQIGVYLNRLPHTVYVDPFLGRGDVYRATLPASKEFLSDLDCKRTKDAVRKSCPPRSNSSSCSRIRTRAKVSCGRDWKASLRHDSCSTLFFLDPPWQDVGVKKMTYRHHKAITPEDLVKRTKGLKGAVAIYYKDNSLARKALCKRPFRCHKIKRNIFNDKYTQLLAIKRSRC